MRHAAAAAIFDVVVDRMGVAARGLERREDRRRLGAAGQHEALANDKILEPALLGHHAVRGGIEFGHGGSCDNWFNSGPRGLPRRLTSLKRRGTRTEDRKAPGGDNPGMPLFA